MTWGRLDDQTATSPGWVDLYDVALRAAAAELFGSPPNVVANAARLAARNAKAVHLLAIMWTVPALTDGLVTPSAVEQMAPIGSMTTDEFYEGAELLVESKAWRRLKPSKSNPLGGYKMVLGWAPGEQPTREQDTHRKQMRRLRDMLRHGRKDHPMRVAAEQRAAGSCEYCGTPTAELTIDHVDPFAYTNDIANLAAVCLPCNRRKGDNGLDEVGMSFTEQARKARRNTRRKATK